MRYLVNAFETDNGRCMSRDQIQRLFDPVFLKGDTSVKSGMDFFVAYSVIKNHGRELNVQSEKDKGTTYTLTLKIQSTERSES